MSAPAFPLKPLLDRCIVPLDRHPAAVRKVFFEGLRLRFCLHCGEARPEATCFCRRDD